MKLVICRAAILSAVLVGAPVLAATPDGFITTKTKLTLLTTGGLRASAIHVDTNDGVVVLYGKIPTPEQKTLAEKTAAQIKGVREVRNLLQVVPDSEANRVAASDKAIKDTVDRMLRNDPVLNDSPISAKSVDKGMVLLTGKAATISDHLRAVATADSIPGVRSVASEVVAPEMYTGDERLIFLIEERGEARAMKEDMKMMKDDIKADVSKRSAEARSSLDDTRTSAAVKMRLWTTANVPSTQINVDTNNGVVTLFGIVPTADSKRLAEAETAKIDGVTMVDNQLQIVAPSKREIVDAKDKDLWNSLKLAFKDKPELRGVNSEIKNGVIRLTGTVDSSWDRLNAVRIARTIPGVRAVEEQVIVKEGTAKPKSQFF